MALVPIQMDKRGINNSIICNAFTVYSIGSITASYYTANISVGNNLFIYTLVGFTFLLISSSSLAVVELIQDPTFYIWSIYFMRFIMGLCVGELMTFGLDIGIKSAVDSNQIYLLSLIIEILCSAGVGLGPYFSSVVLESFGLYELPYVLSLLVTVPLALISLYYARRQVKEHVARKQSSFQMKNEMESMYTGTIVNNRLDVFMIQQKRDKTFVFNYNFNQFTKHINRSERIDLTCLNEENENSNTITTSLPNRSESDSSMNYAYSMNDVEDYMDGLEEEREMKAKIQKEKSEKLGKARHKNKLGLPLSESEKNLMITKPEKGQALSSPRRKQKKESHEQFEQEKGEKPDLNFEIEKHNYNYDRNYEMHEILYFPSTIVNIITNVYVSGVAMNLENQISNNLYKDPYNLTYSQIGVLLMINSILSAFFIGYQFGVFYYSHYKKNQRKQEYLVEINEEHVQEKDFRNQILVGLVMLSVGNMMLSPQFSVLGPFLPWSNSYLSFFLMYGLLQMGWILAYYPLMADLTQSVCKHLHENNPAKVSEAVSGIFNMSWQSGFVVLLFGGALTDYVGFDNMNVIMGFTGCVLTIAYSIVSLTTK